MCVCVCVCVCNCVGCLVGLRCTGEISFAAPHIALPRLHLASTSPPPRLHLPPGQMEFNEAQQDWEASRHELEVKLIEVRGWLGRWVGGWVGMGSHYSRARPGSGGWWWVAPQVFGL